MFWKKFWNISLKICLRKKELLGTLSIVIQRNFWRVINYQQFFEDDIYTTFLIKKLFENCLLLFSPFKNVEKSVTKISL